MVRNRCTHMTQEERLRALNLLSLKKTMIRVDVTADFNCLRD